MQLYTILNAQLDEKDQSEVRGIPPPDELLTISFDKLSLTLSNGQVALEGAHPDPCYNGSSRVQFSDCNSFFFVSHPLLKKVFVFPFPRYFLPLQVLAFPPSREPSFLSFIPPVCVR